jgi:hypothetical protein
VDRALAAWMGDEVARGDAVVVSALGRPTLEHYSRQGGWEDQLGDLRAYPAELDRNPAAVYPTPLDSLPSYEAQARELRGRWEEERAPHIWILAQLAPLGPSSSSTTAPPAGGGNPDVAGGGNSGVAGGGNSDVAGGVTSDMATDAPAEPGMSGGSANRPGATARVGFPTAGSDPMPPPPSRRTITANDLLYPMSVLVYTLRGLEPVDVLREYRQDWLGGERVALRIPRSQFVPLDSLQAIEQEP